MVSSLSINFNLLGSALLVCAIVIGLALYISLPHAFGKKTQITEKIIQKKQSIAKKVKSPIKLNSTEPRKPVVQEFSGHEPSPISEEIQQDTSGMCSPEVSAVHSDLSYPTNVKCGLTEPEHCSTTERENPKEIEAPILTESILVGNEDLPAPSISVAAFVNILPPPPPLLAVSAPPVKINKPVQPKVVDPPLNWLLEKVEPSTQQQFDASLSFAELQQMQAQQYGHLVRPDAVNTHQEAQRQRQQQDLLYRQQQEDLLRQRGLEQAQQLRQQEYLRAQQQEQFRLQELARQQEEHRQIVIQQQYEQQQRQYQQQQYLLQQQQQQQMHRSQNARHFHQHSSQREYSQQEEWGSQQMYQAPHHDPSHRSPQQQLSVFTNPPEAELFPPSPVKQMTSPTHGAPYHSIRQRRNIYRNGPGGSPDDSEKFSPQFGTNSSSGDRYERSERSERSGPGSHVVQQESLYHSKSSPVMRLASGDGRDDFTEYNIFSAVFDEHAALSDNPNSNSHHQSALNYQQGMRRRSPPKETEAASTSSQFRSAVGQKDRSSPPEDSRLNLDQAVDEVLEHNRLQLESAQNRRNGTGLVYRSPAVNPAKNRTGMTPPVSPARHPSLSTPMNAQLLHSNKSNLRQSSVQSYRSTATSSTTTNHTTTTNSATSTTAPHHPPLVYVPKIPLSSLPGSTAPSHNNHTSNYNTSPTNSNGAVVAKFPDIPDPSGDAGDSQHESPTNIDHCISSEHSSTTTITTTVTHSSTSVTTISNSTNSSSTAVHNGPVYNLAEIVTPVNVPAQIFHYTNPYKQQPQPKGQLGVKQQQQQLPPQFKY